MPYIDSKNREALDKVIKQLPTAANAGELNYTLTRIAYEWWSNNGRNYLGICIVIGTFVCAAMEFYRRVAVKYEDGKRRDNGDVYYPI